MFSQFDEGDAIELEGIAIGGVYHILALSIGRA